MHGIVFEQPLLGTAAHVRMAGLAEARVESSEIVHVLHHGGRSIPDQPLLPSPLVFSGPTLEEGMKGRSWAWGLSPERLKLR